MNTQIDFWRGKKVLLTGHTGFKGSWLSLWLQKLGVELVGFALAPPTDPSLFEAAHVAQGMHSIIGDVRDGEHLKEVMHTYQPEIVFHLAAQPLVRYSYKDPIETISTNVLGTANMLEAVRHNDSVRVVVSITSDKCYENKEWYWGYREVDALGGHDPYSASKAAAELVIATYRNSYFDPATYQQHGVAVASTRAGNVIGGGDWAMDRLLPDIMRALMAGQPVLIRNPQATRPWQHVLEPLNGYIMLAECLWQDGPRFAQAWNFGPRDGDVKPVSWIVDYVTQIWGEGASWVKDGADQPHENTFLKLDCSLARNWLGWSPRLNLATALEWIVEWFKGYQRQEDMRTLTEQQISRYKSEGMS
ncbi:MAG: CDP-glucose 4,6-dehydratase [Chloroflexi bacterium]|nr:CDP-glucose 4,6-dehydratase [Chloroflexota bacterium]